MNAENLVKSALGLDWEDCEMQARRVAEYAARQQAVPSGYVMVPVEPTAAMRAPWKTMRGYSWHDKYKAMLAAAPQAEQVVDMQDQLKSAYWDFDARVKGIAPYTVPCGQPEHAFVVSVLNVLGKAPPAPDLTGYTVSMDVSTGDHDAFHRIYGDVVEIAPDKTILCEMTSDNRDVSPAPDVSGLVDSVDALMNEIDRVVIDEQSYLVAASRVRAELAAHKQEGK